MTSWLSKQKKGELQALARSAGINGSDNLLKDELVAALDDQLRENSSRYSNDKLFSEYYERAGSPVKKSRASATAEPADAEKVEKKRRRTIAKDTSSGEATSSALIPRTPASIQRLAANVRLPGSPAVSRAVEAQTNRLANLYKTAVKKAKLKTRIPYARQELSSVEAVNILILIFEAWGLTSYTLPRITIATPPIGNVVESHALPIPNVPSLLTKDFWAPTSLWLLVSLILPGIAAYVFNFTYTNPRPRTRRTAPAREFDPLAFGITKALLAWTLFPKGLLGNTLGRSVFSDKTFNIVNDHIPGGWVSLLIESGIIILTGLHDHIGYKS